MASTAFAVSMAQPQPSGQAISYSMASISEGSQLSVDPAGQAAIGASDRTGSGRHAADGSAILIRRLTRNMTEKELRSMFLFAKDFADSEFIAPELPEDQNFVSAVARFGSPAAAQEAKAMLDGKPNTATEANMIVEILPGPGLAPYVQRRNTIDVVTTRGPPSSASSTASSAGAPVRQLSRFNSTFQSMERISPPASGSGQGASTDFPFPETPSHIQSLFAPQSPVGTQPGERLRVTGKSVINDDSVDDDETGELLKDPIAYATNGHTSSSGSKARRPTNPQAPVTRFAGLSLATNNNMSPSSAQTFASPRSGVSGRAPAPSPAVSPPAMASLGPGSAYQLATQHYQRSNYPPVNPADQNPPCNTLYVGNLPVDTSEDELKAMFSKQRGYKRLCFRTKQNGPMCFVEFEDVSFATKALNELYGHPLHNSVKGGIRLSFSKNPLGVRTGQQGASGLPSPMSVSAAGQGFGGASSAAGPSFVAANGPPPGLSAPPGLQAPLSAASASNLSHLPSPVTGTVVNGVFPGSHMGSGGAGMAGMRAAMSGGIATSAGGGGLHGFGAYQDYMMGR